MRGCGALAAARCPIAACAPPAHVDRVSPVGCRINTSNRGRGASSIVHERLRAFAALCGGGVYTSVRVSLPPCRVSATGVRMLLYRRRD
eukprot:4779863-Prymnesium_polylepis.2